MTKPPRTLALFNYDWDRLGFGRWANEFPVVSAGFDLFRFPSNLRLIGFDVQHFVAGLAARAKRNGWQAVTSNHEQFGALAAALLAERLGWPGTPVAAVLACQHKLYARQVLQQVAPEANIPFAPLASRYGKPPPEDIAYPVFVKPVKAAFSVLARTVRDRDELAALIRFGPWERWVIHRLVEPFERIVRARLPEAGSAHRMVLEQPVTALQYNLDGYVFASELRPLGIVESVMYPGTQAFMRFVYPCALPAAGQARALEVAQRFLQAVGFTHGLFNMEFFYDAAQDRLTPAWPPSFPICICGWMALICIASRWNWRMAATPPCCRVRQRPPAWPQVSSIAVSTRRRDRRCPPPLDSARWRSSFPRRCWARPPLPTAARQRALAQQFPEAMLFSFPKTPGQIGRDFKWLGSYRYGILHLGGRDALDLCARCEAASRLLGWPPPYARPDPTGAEVGSTLTPAFFLESP